MISNKLKVLITILSFAFFGGLFSNGAYAAIPVSGVGGIIKNLTNMTYDGVSQWNCQGNFQPTFEFGNRCNGGICGKAIRHFKCISAGVHGCATEDETLRAKVELMSAAEANAWRDPDGENVFISGHPNHAKYEYYRVTLYTENDLQNVQGVVYRRKKYNVTVKSIDTSGRSLANVPGLGDISREVDGGATATVTHGNTSAGFTFKYWRASNGTNLGNGNSYSISSDVDIVIYAVYEAFNSTSTLDIKVKNSSVAKYNSYRDDTIYAKPTDVIKYQIVYRPSAQGGYSLRPQRISVDGGGAWGINTTLGQALSGWSNSFNIGSVVSNSYSYQNGDTGQKTEYSKDYIVSKDKAGSELPETASLRNDSARTPKKVQIDLDGSGYSIGRVYTGLSDTVKMIVPYNFDNETHKPSKPGEKNVNDDDDYNKSDDELITDNKIVYAGEEDYFNYMMDVNPKKNNVTEGEYATVVREAKWRLELCYDADCARGVYSPSEERTGMLNQNGNLAGQQNIKSDSHRISIPDRYAGSRICIRSAMYPANSGSDTNTNVNGNGQWAYSNRSCYLIAKRPSTQVWGGNIYSQSKIDAQPSVKNNLYGYSEYAYDANAKNRKSLFVFGSWGELGVVGNDLISGFGSGASMGYAKNEGSELDGRVKTWPSYSPANGAGNNAFIVNKDVTPPGGSVISAFCGRVPLTIPNSPCGTSVGSLSSTVSTTKAASEKASIIDLLISGQDSASHINNPAGGVNMGLVGNIIEGNTTKVVSSDDDLVVNGDLIYLDKVYLNYEQMPKLVIYSKKNIYIDCAVSRIDALIIAENTVVTCNNFEGNLTDENVTKHINDPANSNQLYINGTVIASRLVANRTYGAATGANSIVPAEVINFDPTLYRFGGSAAADDDTTGRLDVTYMHELAPRL